MTTVEKKGGDINNSQLNTPRSLIDNKIMMDID